MLNASDQRVALRMAFATASDAFAVSLGNCNQGCPQPNGAHGGRPRRRQSLLDFVQIALVFRTNGAENRDSALVPGILGQGIASTMGRVQGVD